MSSFDSGRSRTAALSLAMLHFLLRFRRTAIGPLWLLVGPSLFIALLGQLYAHVGSVDSAVFVPNLAIGLITWTLVAGFVNGSATVHQRNRAQILQGGLALDDIVMVDVMTTVLAFLHQLPIIVAVLLIYRVPLHPGAVVSIFGLAVVIYNGIWVTKIFGILGARYRDLSEVFQAVMRIAFLATPILWMPGAGMRGGVMAKFLIFNPFYHFIEVVRAPLLGQAIAPTSWVVVTGFSVAGFVLARLFSARYARYVPLWV